MDDKIYKQAIPISMVVELEPYLNKYFGISYQNFSYEILVEIGKAFYIRNATKDLYNRIKEIEQGLGGLLVDVKPDIKLNDAERELIHELNDSYDSIEKILTETKEWVFEAPMISGETKYTDFLAYDMDIEIYHEFKMTDFDKMFTKKRKPNETDIIFDEIAYNVFFLVAVVVTRRKLFERAELSYYSRESPYENYNQMEEDAKRKDLLELYVFLHDIKMKNASPLTITHHKRPVELSNYNHWAESSLKNMLKQALPDIQSLQQAQEELKTYAPKRGRKPINLTRDILIFGIYSLVKDHLNVKEEMPNDLADFIIAYLNLVGFGFPKGKKSPYPQAIKGQVSTMKKKSNPPKLGFKI